MAAPVISHFSILWRGVSLTSGSICLMEQCPDWQEDTGPVKVLRLLSVEESVSKYRQRMGGKSFLFNIHLTTSFFLGDDWMLSKICSHTFTPGLPNGCINRFSLNYTNTTRGHPGVTDLKLATFKKKQNATFIVINTIQYCQLQLQAIWVPSQQMRAKINTQTALKSCLCVQRQVVISYKVHKRLDMW